MPNYQQLATRLPGVLSFTNDCIGIGFVPDDFGTCVMVPIVKDPAGDITDVDNYRGITLSPVISKMFEYCVMGKFHELNVNKKAQLSLTKPHDAKSLPKIAPIRRAYNVVADNTGLSSFV